MAHLGSCLCGRVRFRIEGALPAFGNCHCSICRKATGSAFWTAGPVQASTFTWLSGDGSVRWYESSPGCLRGFCACCGSTLAMQERRSPEIISISVAALDTQPTQGLVANQFVGSKAPWYEITDALAAYDEGPPTGTYTRNEP